MGSLMTKHNSGEQIEENEWAGHQKKKIFEKISQKSVQESGDGNWWTGFVYLRKRTNSKLCERGNETSHSIYVGKFLRILDRFPWMRGGS